MAKKATKKAPAKKAAKKAPAKKKAAAKKVAPKKARARQPRNAALPGMEEARHASLDGYCEEIGDALDAINEATAEKKAALVAAKDAMIKAGVTHYTNAGVRLTCTPGDYTVSCKRVKDGEGDGGELPQAPELDPAAGDVLDDLDEGDF